ncbi:MAG: DMT family transporter [Ignisphaera sp.]
MGRAVHAILFVVAATSIGSASILVRLSNASPIACAFWRLAIAATILALVPTGEKVLWSMPRKHFINTLIAGFALAAHFVLWMDSLFRVSVAVSTTIVVLYPVHLAIIEFAKGEKPTHLEVMGIATSFLSVVLLAAYAQHSPVKDSFIGVAESFAASIAAAIYFYMGRASRRYMGIKEYSVATYASASIATLVYSFIAKDNVLAYLQKSWAWLLALAVVPMIGGHTTMNHLLKFYRSSTVTSIALAEPAIATTLATIILKESLEPIYIVSLALATAGTAIVIMTGRVYEKQ